MSDEHAGRRIAIVGGAGFVGHHLALGLARRGAHVEVVDGLSVNNLLSVEGERQPAERRRLRVVLHQRLDLLDQAGVRVHVVDARDYAALTTTVAWQIKPHVLIHLADAARTEDTLHATFDSSLRTLENALDVSRGGTVEHFVFFSSSQVYGPGAEPAREDDPLDPVGVQGAIKFAGERLVIAYGQVFDLSWTIVRPSLLYGPRNVSRTIEQALIEEALSGSIRPRGPAQAALDLTHVDDLVEGVSRLIGSPAARKTAFNLASGRARTLGELVSAVRAQLPAAVTGPGEPEALPVARPLCIDRARSLLGWEPRRDLEGGLAEYAAWYRETLA